MDHPRFSHLTLNLDALRSFIAIVETGSFRGAAARVNKSPSAISLQIAKLEEVLDTRLMDRDARNVTLTHNGDLLLEDARRMLAINDRTIGRFRGGSIAAHICIAAPHDLGMSLVPRFLKDMANLYPDLHIDVRLGTTEFVEQSLAEGHAHLGLFNDIHATKGPVTTLYSEPLSWLTLKGGCASEQTPLPLSVALAKCAWRDAAIGALEQVNRPYRIAYSSDTAMGQIAAVRADLAIAALPVSLADRDLDIAPQSLGLPPLPHTHIQMADDGSEAAKLCAQVLAPTIQQLSPFGLHQNRPKQVSS